MEKRRKFLFSTILLIYPWLHAGVNLHIQLWNEIVRFIFLHSANLIFRGTYISKYFREALGFRDNESRLYVQTFAGCLVPTVQKANRTISETITKTRLYSFDPLKPHFYIVKLGFTGVYIIFLILLENIDCGYSLEPPRRGGSNEYPQCMFWAEIWKILEFLSENFQFFGD